MVHKSDSGDSSDRDNSDSRDSDISDRAAEIALLQDQRWMQEVAHAANAQVAARHFMNLHPYKQFLNHNLNSPPRHTKSL